MTRKKVKLAFITNDSSRKATFKKRKKGLIKKVSELSTLCGVEACAIIYSPYESQPEVWPNNMGANRVIARFKRMPEMEQCKKMVNQESYIRQRVAKAAELLKKQQRETREKEITVVMYECLIGKGLQDFMMADLYDLGWLIDQNLKEINKRIESLKKMARDIRVPLPLPLSPRSKTRPSHEIGIRRLAPPILPSLPRARVGRDNEIEIKGLIPPPLTPSPRAMLGPNHEMGIRGSSHQQVVENLGLNLSMDASMQRPHWFSEWMKNPSEHMNFGNGGEIINDNHHNTMWSGVFFP